MTVRAETSVDPSEIDKFSAWANQWWDETGPFAPLHRLNPIRLRWIVDAIGSHFQRDVQKSLPLSGMSVLDIGCGGGLVTEPLARLGASVMGIDAAEKNIEAARFHAQEVQVPVHYDATTAEALAQEGRVFDVVLALEVVEHVADVAVFIDSCAALVKPGGMLVVSTLNRTLKSYALAIIGAEYILRWLPKGTHEWKKFLKPSEVAAHFRRCSLTLGGATGIIFHPLRNEFSLDAHDLDVNYMMWGCKNT